MATDDRFELVLEGTCLGKNVRNVFYYLQSNGASSAAAILAAQFRDGVLQNIRTIVTLDMIFQSISVKNLDNPEDFTETVISPAQAGNVSAETMPPFVTFSFIYHRTTLLVRNGWKRFAGVPETYVVGGVIVAGAQETAVNAVAEALDEPVTDGIGSTFIPRIMSKQRVPETGEFEMFLYTDWPVGDVDFAHIGSQNTRKF